MRAYTHGGDVASFAKKFGCKESEIADLSSNINFLQPHTDIAGTDIATYPRYETLYDALGSHFGISCSQFALFNGASSAIFALMAYLPHTQCCIYAPAYSEYKKAAALFDKSITLIDRFTKMDTPVDKNALVVFVNPSTPDGCVYDMQKLLAYWHKQNACVIIDESFLQYCNTPSAARWLQEYDNLYIIRSLTKFYSCAGVRIGLVLSGDHNIQKLAQKQPPWPVSAFDGAYIAQALGDKRFHTQTLQITKQNKTYLYDILNNSGLFSRIYPSQANFVLARLRNKNARWLQAKLSDAKILIRNCENFDFLDDTYVRFAVKSRSDLQRLQAAFEKIGA